MGEIWSEVRKLHTNFVKANPGVKPEDVVLLIPRDREPDFDALTANEVGSLLDDLVKNGARSALRKIQNMFPVWEAPGQLKVTTPPAMDANERKAFEQQKAYWHPLLPSRG